MNLMTFHVERLYDDACWKPFRAAMDALASAGIRATCFVFPPLHPRHTGDPAFARGGEGRFRDRLAALAADGHEIQQHTHIYAADRKEIRITPEDCLRAIGGEKEYLERLGYPIRGFLSGGFSVNGTVVDALARLGFAYDCSVTLFPKTYEAPTLPGIAGLARLPQGLWELPTTHTLRMLALNAKRAEGSPYRMPYAHDYDFVRAAYRFSMKAILFRYGRAPWATVSAYLDSRSGETAAGPAGAGAQAIGPR